MAKKQKPANKRGITPKKKKATPKGYPAWFTNARLHCLLIFGFCLILYGNTLTLDYTLDDAIVIHDNEFTKQGFAGIEGLLKYDTFRGFFKVEGKDQLVMGGRYRPLTPIIFAIQVGLFGESPLIGHLGNLLFYALTCIVLYLLLLKLFSPGGNRKKGSPKTYFIALLTTLLFTAHPIHTEVVANIKGLDEIFTLLGSLAALYFSLKAYYDKKPSWNVAAGLLFFLALLSKENAITFLAVIPLTYFVFTKAKAGTVLRQMIPFALMAIVFLVIRGSILGWELGQSRELMNNPFLKIVGNQYVDFTTGEKLATVFYTLGKYIQLQIFPHPLTHDYYPRHVEIMSFADWKVLLSLLFHLAIGIIALLRLRKKDPLSYAIFFYLITLSIVSNIVVNVGTNMNERFVFMSSVGFCLAIAVLGYRWSEKRTGAKVLDFKGTKMIFAISAVILVLFSVKTITRNFDWKDNYTLFLTDIETSVNSAKLNNTVGGDLLKYADCQEPSPYCPENEEEKKAMRLKAIEHLNKALSIHPNYANAHLLLANANTYLQQYEQAIPYYKRALSLKPGYPEAINSLGITYRLASQEYIKQKKNLPTAIQYLTEVEKMNPQDAEIKRLLATAYGLVNNEAKSMEYFQKAAQLQPKNSEFWLYRELGRFYGEQKNDLVNSIQYLKQAYNVKPDDFDTIRLLGVAYGFRGNNAKSIEFFTKAAQIQPNNANIFIDLGTAWYQSGDHQKANEYFAKAKEINPNIENERRRQ